MRLYGVEHRICRESRSRLRRVAAASSSGCAGDLDVHTVTPSNDRSGGLRSKEGDHAAWNPGGRVTQDLRIPESVVTFSMLWCRTGWS